MLVGVEEGRAPAARLTRGAPPRRTTTARLRACWASWRPRRAGRTRARPAAWARPRCRCRSCPCPAVRPRPAACRCRPGPAATPPPPRAILCGPCCQTLAPGFGARPELDGEVHEPCRFGGRGALPGAPALRAAPPVAGDGGRRWQGDAEALNLRRARQSALLGHAGGGAGALLAYGLPNAAALQHAGHAARPLYAQQHLGPQFAQPVRARSARGRVGLPPSERPRAACRRRPWVRRGGQGAAEP